MYIFSPNSLNKIYSTTSINSNLHSNIYSSRPRTATKHRSSFTRSKFDMMKMRYVYIYECRYIYIYICVYIFISATMPRAQERVLVLTSASTLLASFGPMIPPRSPMLPPREYKKLRIFPLPQKTSLCAAFLWSAALQIYIFSFCKIEKHKDVFYLWNDFECSPNNMPNSRTADSPNNRSTEPPNPSTTE